MNQTNELFTKEFLTKKSVTKKKTPIKETTIKYPVKHFINKGESKDDSKALIQVIEQNALATLLYSDDNAELHISHIPFHFNESPILTMNERRTNTLVGYELMGHISNEHPLAQQIKEKKNINITLIFHGAEDYISPNDVSVENRIKQNVPTWNYAKVHVKGTIVEISDGNSKYQQMSKTSRHFEQASMQQQLIENDQREHWSFESVPKQAIEGMFKAITLFTLTISDIEGRFKLSQNKPVEIREQIANKIAKRNKLTLAKLVYTS